VTKAEKQAFVLLNANGDEQKKFDTLADAVLAASDGDVVEVRGNGPFVSDGVIIGHPLVIRAGEGYIPAITLSQEAADKNIPLLTTSASLVLEGLELRRMGGAKGEFENRYPFLLVAWGKGAIHISNCRFVFDAPDDWNGAILKTQFPACTIRNCQFLTDTRNVISWWCPPKGRTTIENCVSSTAVLMELALRGTDFTDVNVQAYRNTTVGKCLALGFDQAQEPAGDSPIRLDFSENLTHCPPELHLGTLLRLDQAYLEPSLSAPEAEAFLAALVSLHEQHNVYTAGTRMLHHAVFRKTRRVTLLEAAKGKDLAGWNLLWKQSDTGSFEGVIRFQGGDLLQKALTAPATLTLEDFRLRPDSAGYQAGPNGKDLGADVDLVGPGPAYERWKKTPEYQQWLGETGQQK
jgi:hypothetical protein